MEVKELHDDMQKTFKVFKEANDKLIEEVKTLGTAKAETKELVEKLNTRLDDIEVKLNRPVMGAAGGDLDEEAIAKRSAFLKFCRKGKDSLTPEELKVMYVSDDTTGGYLATPPDYILEIIKEVVEFSPVRALARVRTTSSRAIQIPKRTGTASATWVAERGTRAETDNPAYGLEEIPAHEMTARADVSQTNLEDSAFDIEGEIRSEFAEQFGVAEGLAFISGDAVGKPEGILTNADVSETVSGDANLVTSDGLIDIFYAIKGVYAANASWMMRRATVGIVRKLKGTDNQYLWQPGLQAGQPAMLLGSPVFEAVDMPAVAANAYPILYGDFRRAYAIADRVQIDMIRDPFTLAADALIRFIGRKRVGGQIVLAEAIRKQKISA